MLVPDRDTVQLVFLALNRRKLFIIVCITQMTLQTLFLCTKCNISQCCEVFVVNMVLTATHACIQMGFFPAIPTSLGLHFAIKSNF